jgi:nitroimidazol reductase NimA-like FMN-containing flavoprotein (pyridoxamine 5'-phosphate oxidase superfamily)
MTQRTRIRRLPEKTRIDRASLDAILDAALVAHVGIVDDGQPYVLPMACARDGDRLLIHGSTGSRTMRLMAHGAPVCATVTHLDALVLARSAFNSSMNYRSAVILGSATVVDDAIEALRILTEHLLPGRWEVLRPPTRKELAATTVVALPLTEWSVKVSDGPPDDEPDDLSADVWAGVVPLTTGFGAPIPAPDLLPDAPAPSWP